MGLNEKITQLGHNYLVTAYTNIIRITVRAVTFGTVVPIYLPIASHEAGGRGSLPAHFHPHWSAAHPSTQTITEIFELIVLFITNESPMCVN